ncbi:unnamed protein product [Leptosia nina]|uniref:Uncharacterized protein n=1 Tax=Leptosia nina TaxID=320188 RepID=A0AAV1IXY5_9NEOP
MTQRLHKIYGTNRQKPNCDSSPRPEVSFEDAEKMSIEREKIRNNYAVKYPEDSREFSNCYHGHKVNDPLHIAASHVGCAAEPEKKALKSGIKKPAILSFPSFVPGSGLCWSPSLERSTENIQEKEQLVCRRCRNCKQTFVSERGRVYKDNIMRFSDISTMTPCLNDAACGPPIEASHSSSISLSMSNVAVRDEPEPQVRFTPSPTVRSIDDDASFNFDYYEQRPVEITECYDEVYQRGAIEYTKSRRTILPKCSNLNEIGEKFTEPRKNLYNEGISDTIAENFSGRCPLTNRIQISEKRGYSKTSVFGKNAEIPFAHRNRSKYHSDCKTELKKKPLRCGVLRKEEVRLAAEPKAMRFCQPGATDRCDVQPCIRMPRKVLSSERNIDSFILSQSIRPKFF